MTRNEYDKTIAVKFENTEGFTYEDVKWINDYIFAKVSEEDAGDDFIKMHCENLFIEASLKREEMNARFA